MGGAMSPWKMKRKDAEAWNYSWSGGSPMRLPKSPWTSTSPSTSPLPSPPHPSLLPPEYPLSMPTPYRSLLVSTSVSSPRSPPLPRQASALTKKTAFKNRIGYRAKLLWHLALFQGRMLSQKLLLNFLPLRNRVCGPACFSRCLKKRNVSHWTAERSQFSPRMSAGEDPPLPTLPLPIRCWGKGAWLHLLALLLGQGALWLTLPRLSPVHELAQSGPASTSITVLCVPPSCVPLPISLAVPWGSWHSVPAWVMLCLWDWGGSEPTSKAQSQCWHLC